MDPFIGEIRIMGFNYPPYGWALCNGQIMQINQNSALFAVIGNIYGGDGKTTFALPNLQGRSPLHIGHQPGPGLTVRTLAQASGSQNVTLTETTLANHTHDLRVANTDGSAPGPVGNTWAGPGMDRDLFWYNAGTSGSTVNMNAAAICPTGNGGPHTNMMPYLALNFCIAIQGVFPVRP